MVGVTVSRDLARRAGSASAGSSSSYGQEATSDPPKLYTAVFGAAALGLVMAAVVVGIDRLLMRNRPPEAV